MTEPTSTKILQCVDRFRAGDPKAADELFRSIGNRLDHLARRMLAGFPTVKHYAETDDVVQGASMRLLTAIRDLRPETSRDFFNLAAVQIRRELLDLSRRFCGRPWASDDNSTQTDPADRAPLHDEIDQWTRFHEAVEKLPVEEREAIGLVFYHGCTRGEAAEILGVSERTVHRWWQSGCERLNERLGGDLPMT